MIPANSPGADFDIEAFLAAEEAAASGSDEASLALAQKLARKEEERAARHAARKAARQQQAAQARGGGSSSAAASSSSGGGFAARLGFGKKPKAPGPPEPRKPMTEAELSKQIADEGLSGEAASAELARRLGAQEEAARAGAAEKELRDLAASLAEAAAAGDEDAIHAKRAAEAEADSLALAKQLAEAEVPPPPRPLTKVEKRLLKERKEAMKKAKKEGRDPNSVDPRHSLFLMGGDDPDFVDPSVIPPELWVEHLQAMEQLRAPPPPPPPKEYKPYFIYATTWIHVATLIYGVVLEGGFADWKTENPMIGPGRDTLKAMGAKWVPCLLAGQWWRFFTPSFLHVGIIHFLFNMSFQWPVGRRLEMSFGPWRIAFVWFCGALGGNLLSSLFLPTMLQAGASSSLFGLLGVLGADLVQNWKNIITPGKHLRKLLSAIGLSLAIGLLPFVDNFAHLGGLFTGLCAGIMVIPTITFGAWQRRRRYTLMAVSFALLLLSNIFGLVIFYNRQDADVVCPACTYLNCVNIPFVDFNWCDLLDVEPEDFVC